MIGDAMGREEANKSRRKGQENCFNRRLNPDLEDLNEKVRD